MKAKYLYIAAGAAFLIAAGMEFRAPHSTTAVVLDLLAAAIFLYLGFSPPKTPRS